MMQYILQLSSKRKTISITIKKDRTVKVFAPKRCNIKIIEDFVQQSSLWIEKKLQELPKEQIEINQEYKHNSIFWYLGEEHIMFITDGCLKNKIEIIDKNIFVNKKTTAIISKIVNKYFIEIATKVFNERLQVCHNLFNNFVKCDIPTLKIRFAKTRWGSMSSSNSMMLNAKLIYANTAIIDYVIFHELCHIKHKNHGPKFYDLFEKILPNFKDMRKQIKIFFKSSNDID